MTLSRTSLTAQPSAPTDDPTKITKWSLLADCSHSSAVAVGQRCRLAFHRAGLHAFGGYIEGFLPEPFSIEAVASDDKILAFLQLNNQLVQLSSTKTHFVLTRGDAKVKFEASSDVPLPAFPEVGASTAINLPEVDVLEALLEVAPKTGWGALNAEMLGIVLSSAGAVATDNISLGWSNAEAYPAVMVVPRPFCLAYIRWVRALGKDVHVETNGIGILAEWTTGEKLYGVLPASPRIEMDFSTLFDEAQTLTYCAFPDQFKELLDEAAIFADEITLQTNGKALSLSTSGPVSWHREVMWEGDAIEKSLTLPLKRLRTSLDYADILGVVENRLHLSTEVQDLHIIIAGK